MMRETTEGVGPTGTPYFDTLLSGLPPGSELQMIDFAAERPTDQVVLLELPHPIQRWAVRCKEAPGGRGMPPDLQVLTLPSSNQDDLELLARVRAWIDAAAPYRPASIMMTLQGAQILWSPGRLAILAQSDRLPAIRTALIEALFYESELRDIERVLGDTWPVLEADLPLAFEFDARSLRKRRQLMQQFRQTLLLRARLSRLAPHVHCPHIYPPTLASRVVERLRERTRMAHRHDMLIEQVDVFERVYESCGQRVSEFMLNRSNNALVWVVIVLLLVQIVFT